MTITITPGATTATTAVLNFAGYGGDGTIDLQIASRPDFSFCVAPVISIPRGDTYTLIGLNQEATLYARARTRSAAGVLETWGATAGFRTPLATARVTTAQSIMVEPAALVFPNTILAAFSAQTIAGYPADNVGIPAPVAWRGQSAAGGQQTVTLDIVTPGDPADSLAILNTNMPEVGTITVSAGENFGALTAVITNARFRASVNVPGRPGYHGYFKFTSRSAKCWRIQLIVAAGAGPPAGVFHVEHVVLGQNLASRNANGDKTETPVGLTTTERTRTGILDRVPGIPIRRSEFDLSNLTERDFETLYGQLWRRQGDTVFCVPNSRDNAFRHDRMLLGEFGAGRISGVQGIRFTRGMSIDSII
jgi:hypothetical protein